MSLLNILQRPPKVRLLYLHVPKTGGTSVNAALKELYFDLLRPHSRRLLRLQEYALPLTAGVHGLTRVQIRDVVLHYGLIHDQSIRLAVGHWRYTASVIEQLGPEWLLAAILREPVSRWLSAYYYNRYKESSYRKTNLELGDYLESPTGAALGWSYVRIFLSEAPTPNVTQPTASMIAEAKRNLSQIHVLGLLEELDDFIGRLGQALGRRLYVGHYRQSPAPQHVREHSLDRMALQRIARLCEPDQEIYQHAKQLLRQTAPCRSRTAQ